MTIREYILTKFEAFSINDAVLQDVIIGTGLDLDGEYDSDSQEEAGKAQCGMIEELILMPRMSNISENGFSQSWDYASLGRYYLWLCRRWGVKPNVETVAALGIPTITDRSSVW